MSLITLFRPAQRAVTAHVRTSACRGYVVELDPGEPGPVRLVTDPHGRVIHFRSLERVREALRARGVRQARLFQHHACEELGALHTWPSEGSGAEQGVPMLEAAAG